jgi:predicted nuclease of predicted toxin-antitoxin system
VRIKLDENLPRDAGDLLTDLGHAVDTVADEGLVGGKDETVVAAAAREQRLLLSLDRGLGDIRTYPPGSHAGIVVLRPEDQATPSVLATVRALAEHHDLDALKGCVVVVRGHLVRIRRPE